MGRINPKVPLKPKVLGRRVGLIDPRARRPALYFTCLVVRGVHLRRNSAKVSTQPLWRNILHIININIVAVIIVVIIVVIIEIMVVIIIEEDEI